MRATHATHPPGDLHSAEPAGEEELIMHLERDQFVVETRRPVLRARLGPRTAVALWALRIFVVVVGTMVIYTFLQQLN
jgi:hypothetical protein